MKNLLILYLHFVRFSLLAKMRPGKLKEKDLSLVLKMDAFNLGRADH